MVRVYMARLRVDRSYILPPSNNKSTFRIQMKNYYRCEITFLPLESVAVISCRMKIGSAVGAAAAWSQQTSGGEHST